jgi:biopolymer transport protein ExbB
LITTAAGMIVAIPALVAYRYFQRRIIDINAQFETQAGLMIQELYDYQLLDNINSSAMSQLITHAAVDDKSSHVNNELSIDTSDLNHTAAAT